MKNSYDIIVVGVGSMGSATCYSLAKRGCRVLGLEKFDIPHGNGSGHGFSRIIRSAYFEHSDYVPLLKSSFALWRELEAESGERLLYLTGGLYMGRSGDGLPGRCRHAAVKYGLPFEWLDEPRLREHFPQFSVPADFVGMLEPNAGFVLPEKAISVQAQLALLKGAELHGQEAVLSWTSDHSGVSVVTNRGRYFAGKIVFCGGAWTDKLVRGLGVPLQVTRQVLGWVWPKKTDGFMLGRLPIWVLENTSGADLHYGFPMMADSPGFKIAYHAPTAAVDPDTVTRSARPEDEESFRPMLRKYIPDADGPLLSMRVCLYTNSPDGNFIIDHHPERPNAVMACGFSGHGFKFATVIGEIMADLAMDGVTRHPVGFLGLSRFAGKS